MNLDSLREFCLSLPGATEGLQWGEILLFRVGGKIFVMVSLDPADEARVMFKCDPQTCAELLEREGVEPAPYVGRYHWVALRDFEVLPNGEFRELLRASYELVSAKLPKKRKANHKGHKGYTKAGRNG